MNIVERNLTGLIPAAGKGKRLGKLPFSKELLPIGIHAQGQNAGIRTAIDAAISRFEKEKISRVITIISPEKRDIRAHLERFDLSDVEIDFVVVQDSPSVPASLDAAYPYTRTGDVALLFPDILFETDFGLQGAANELVPGQVDIALILVPAVSGAKVDIVTVDDGNRIINIAPKPGSGTSGWTWVAACWTACFTEFMHDFVVKNVAPSGLPESEVYVGDVIDLAIRAGMGAIALQDPAGQARDIGTLDELADFWKIPF